MSIAVPRGFRLAGVHCGIKGNPTKPDLALVVTEAPTVAAGVYTQNKVFAAPVGWNRSHTPSRAIRALVVNSGNANACTGPRGDEDAATMARLAAAVVGAAPTEALVLSTGVIGKFLPMEKIAEGITAAARQLGTDEAHLLAAARGMLTTDTCHKVAGRNIKLPTRQVQLTGMAKGAAMIGPNMATMLGVLLTDAVLDEETARRSLSEAVDESFNCISVDGHTSTNDTVLLLASGAAGGGVLAASDLAAFRAALGEVCAELARAIPADGEGATHLVTIDVTGAASRAAAHKIARTVAESPLVKTAIAGADPNWGRIVSAVGYAGVPLNAAAIGLKLNGHVLYKEGAPVKFEPETVSASIRDQRDTHIEIELADGEGRVRFWTTDLTAEYVRLNADYHT
ncbi:MAG: bifunctional glutamate N-acetyltransferase/amino-acid acetyltransferase ArgJ [Pirellulales bacterium]